jgi:hypothetical protein
MTSALHPNALRLKPDPDLSGACFIEFTTEDGAPIRFGALLPRKDQARAQKVERLEHERSRAVLPSTALFSDIRPHRGLRGLREKYAVL